MKKSIIILLCITSGIISCLKSGASDPEFTEITMTGVSAALNQKMFAKNEAYKIDFFTLKITPAPGVAGCTTINEAQTPTGDKLSIELRTRNSNDVDCIYNVDISYGSTSNGKVYFTGRTTLGPKQENKFTTPKTVIKVILTFIETGETTQQEISSGSADITTTSPSSSTDSCTEQILNSTKDSIFCYVTPDTDPDKNLCQDWCEPTGDIETVTVLTDCDTNFVSTSKEKCQHEEKLNRVCIHFNATDKEIVSTVCD